MTPFASFETRLAALRASHSRLLQTSNIADPAWNNGWFQRYTQPVVTAEHVPLEWRYDLNPESNPLLLERLGVNAVFNAGAIEYEGQICLACRVEGNDRKSFFAIARSKSGVQRFVFDDEPILLPQTSNPDVNVYDMRLVQHEDGFIYGTFCSERKDPTASRHDTSSAVAACGMVRTKDLRNWERLPDLVSLSAQQRNVVIHPRLVNGQYGFYTRPQDGFIDTGSGGGIGFALAARADNAHVGTEQIVEPRTYHTIKEVKNGMGAAPLETSEGWLHIAHGVRNTAAGLRYVLYAFLCDGAEPWRVTHAPGGYFMAPQGEERVGDVSNVLFCNGVVKRSDNSVLIYYASSDTRLHVATTTLERLLDYVKNTPSDPLFSHKCVEQRLALIRRNRQFAQGR